MITLDSLKKSIRDVPNFPMPGILFKDLTTSFKSPDMLSYIVDEITENFKTFKITKVIGIESRGFIVGSTLAYKLNAGFVPVRKPGKLPADKYSKKYLLEYGEDCIELHKDALDKNDVVLLHDDLLATGGTAKAAVELIQQTGVKQIFLSFIVELEFLKGREKIGNNFDIHSLVKF